MSPQIQELLQLFDYEHLPPALQEVSKPFGDLANQLAGQINGTSTPTVLLVEALKALKVSKDWAVNARVIQLGM